eukprot:TRINITY_DN2540_c2_g1_i1.p1 TRINITY_DN2540_c2_g1~~TRINITY_DN2540_c2_g1_i1.p1  ORF type:complete len:395 (+),score=71.69 TRINITY_DN2540_c2_g1_i1:59-1186(+)
MWHFLTPCIRERKTDLREIFDVKKDELTVEKGVGVHTVETGGGGGGVLETQAVAICSNEPGVLDEINGDGGFPVGGRWLEGKEWKLFYTVRGDEGPGEVVVLLHGLVGYSFVWERFTDWLLEQPHKKRLQIVSIDFLGRGRSHPAAHQANPRPHNLAFHVDQVKAVLEDIGLIEKLTTPLPPPGVRRHVEAPPKLTLVGASLGGSVAVGFAAAYPGLVSRLMLISPLGAPGCLPAYVSQLGSLPFSSTLLSLYTAFKGSLTSQLLPEASQEHLELQDLNTAFLPSLLSTLLHFPLEDMLHHFKAVGAMPHIKTLLLWGQEDMTNPYHLSSTVHSLLGKRCSFMPLQAGHAIPLTNPEKAVAGLITLLTEPKDDLF